MLLHLAQALGNTFLLLSLTWNLFPLRIDMYFFSPKTRDTNNPRLMKFMSNAPDSLLEIFPLTSASLKLLFHTYRPYGHRDIVVSCFSMSATPASKSSCTCQIYIKWGSLWGKTLLNINDVDPPKSLVLLSISVPPV